MTITVADLAKRVGVPAHVVRHYTRIGLLKPRRNRSNRYRLYAESDVIRLRFIRRAKSLAFTLSDIGLILRDADRGVAPCPQVREMVRRRARDNERRLAAAKRLQARILAAVDLWETMPDEPPDHESLCRLIDAVALVDGDDKTCAEHNEHSPDE
ncbi:MAG: MerR family transcriptional regulator [Burkholderiales bacterium]|nr:MerR family transcriptional regulator [Burkholderiales bacterium]